MRVMRGQGRARFIRVAGVYPTLLSLSATQTQTASLSTAVLPPPTPKTATQTQTASLAMQILGSYAVPNANVHKATVRRSRASGGSFTGIFGVYPAHIVATPTLSLTQTQTATVSTRVTVQNTASVSATQTQTASLSLSTAYRRSLTVTQTQTASVTTAKGSRGPLGFRTFGSGSYPTISVGALHFSGGSQDGDMGVGNSTYGAVEPSVYFDGTTWHLWYHSLDATGTTNRIEYATSSFPNGPWAQQGVIVAGSYQCPQVVYQGGTFHLTATNVADSSHTVDYYTASNPAGPFTLVQSAILSVGSSSQWDGSAIGNTYPYWDGSQWWVFYDAINTTSYGTPVAWSFGTWRGGIATGASLTSLTKSGSNPIFDLAPGACGGRMMGSSYVTRGTSGRYYCFLHEEDNGTSGTAFLTPTSLAVWESTALGSGWTRVGWLHRLFNNPAAKGDQIADPFIYEADGNVHLYFDSSPGQSPYTQFRLGHAVYPGAVDDLVNAIRFSPLSNTTTQPTVNTGQIVLTLNSSANPLPITMDGTISTALGSDPGTSQTAGTYYRSGTTLKLGTASKTHVTIAATAATSTATQTQTATLTLLATYAPRQVFVTTTNSSATGLEVTDSLSTNLTVSDALMTELVTADIG